MLCLDQEMIFFPRELIEYMRANTTSIKTPVLAITFLSNNAKCESIPKPPYLSGIVTYEGDQTATSLTFMMDAMVASPQQAPS